MRNLFILGLLADSVLNLLACAVDSYYAFLAIKFFNGVLWVSTDRDQFSDTPSSKDGRRSPNGLLLVTSANYYLFVLTFKWVQKYLPRKKTRVILILLLRAPASMHELEWSRIKNISYTLAIEMSFFCLFYSTIGHLHDKKLL